MMRRITILLTALMLTVSCATVEETTDEENDEEQEEVDLMRTELNVDEELLPDWYSVEKKGEVIDGHMYGYARSLGSDTDWAYENALRQASINLRMWVDEQIEQARDLVAEQNGAAADREFIIQLRNAITSLTFDHADTESSDFEDNEGVRHVVVKIEITSDDVLSEIGTRLGEYDSIWEQMKQQQPLADW